ncbi:MAG: leucine-rich repeat domain-containing protein [Bacteroidota bacterium]|nr:leucine-rich repeat domain-containing protein [Bacteroidota bacterium]MDP3145515.1 leucine-rich repeat domain-containing protein [Bacteroidota bacterium]
MKKLIFIFLIFLIKISGYSQETLLDSVALSIHDEYTNLDSARKHPDDVIKLVLRKKKYKSFPSQILKFKNLQYLDLSKNLIKEIPDSIIILKNLQVLIVSKTGLESLPNTIGGLKNLKYLNVNQNEIGRLPYSFGELENLEIADLWSNNLDYFPETLKKLNKLKSMDLRNILIPQIHQDNIQSMLPNTIIYFSPACKCSW